MLDGRRGAEHDPERGRLASAAPLPPGSADLGLAEQARVRAGQVGARPRGRLELLASGTGSSCSQACALEPAPWSLRGPRSQGWKALGAGVCSAAVGGPLSALQRAVLKGRPRSGLPVASLPGFLTSLTFSFRLSPVSHGNTIALFFRSLLPNYNAEVRGLAGRGVPSPVDAQHCSRVGTPPAQTHKGPLASVWPRTPLAAWPVRHADVGPRGAGGLGPRPRRGPAQMSLVATGGEARGRCGRGPEPQPGPEQADAGRAGHDGQLPLPRPGGPTRGAPRGGRGVGLSSALLCLVGTGRPLKYNC